MVPNSGQHDHLSMTQWRIVCFGVHLSRTTNMLHILQTDTNCCSEYCVFWPTKSANHLQFYQSITLIVRWAYVLHTESPMNVINNSWLCSPLPETLIEVFRTPVSPPDVASGTSTQHTHLDTESMKRTSLQNALVVGRYFINCSNRLRG